ncbi:MAG: leucine-rich repeat domain-containing protein [Deltaproteobacteria bacterium]|jgi:Leucine-rich repeat (LRR) protein|nr:leucine-rich repeat domain-containing protein [Deltaproteobacteria bacterium]
MSKKIEVCEPSSVAALAALVRDHPAAGLSWDLSSPGRVIVEGRGRLAMTVEEGSLVRLDLTELGLKGALRIGELPDLESLSVNCPGVTEVDFRDLPKLETLHLDNLSFHGRDGTLALGSLPALSDLRIRGCALSDISDLMHLSNVVSLNLSRNRVKSVEALFGMFGLVNLDLSDNWVDNLGPLSWMAKLRDLDVSRNRVSSLKTLAKLEDLKLLAVSRNPLADARQLGIFGNLAGLSASDVGLTDLSPIAGLADLRYLELSGNGLVDIGPISALRRMVYLDLSMNGIEDVSPLEGLAGIERLDLSDNKIIDVAPLMGLMELRELDVSGNEIADIRGLGKLPRLEHLDLGRNHIVDLAPLAGLPRFKSANLSHNKGLDDKAIADFLYGMSKLSRRQAETGKEKDKKAKEEKPKASKGDKPKAAREEKPKATGKARKATGEKPSTAVAEKAQGGELAKDAESLVKIDVPSEFAAILANDFVNWASSSGAKDLGEAAALVMKAVYGSDFMAQMAKIEARGLGEAAIEAMGALFGPEFLRQASALFPVAGGKAQKTPARSRARRVVPETNGERKFQSLLEAISGFDLDDLMREARDLALNDGTDDSDSFQNLEDIEDLPPEIMGILRDIGGVGRVKFKKVSEDLSELPGVPKGTLVIRCQVEVPDDDPDFSNALEERIRALPGVSALVHQDDYKAMAKAEVALKKFKAENPDKVLTQAEEEEYKKIQQMFYLMGEKPTKSTLH